MNLSMFSLVLLALFSLGTFGTNAHYNGTSLLSSGHIQLGDWQAAYNKASYFVQSLTNEEKVLLITTQDIPSKNFTALVEKDSLTSPSNLYFVSAFPTVSALAMTWDKDLVLAVSKAIGWEHWKTGSQIINGPVSNPMGRCPWGGRNVESFGPDPYFNGALFGITVEGLLESGIVVGGKHFLLNEQETNRESSDGVASPRASSPVFLDAYSANVDDKALHETYLRPFYDAVKSGMGAIMCAMMQVNGTYSCENSELINRYLKTELGFPGFTYPDVAAQRTAFGSANGGLDQGSSDYWSNSTILAGLNNGSLSQDRLDDMGIRNLMGYYFKDLDSCNQPKATADTAWRNVRGNNSKIIREAGAKSMVLLKNNGVLPLNDDIHNVGVFGAHAGSTLGGPNFQFSVAGQDDIYQGHITTPGGSGAGASSYVISPHYALTTVAEENGMMLWWVMNNTWTDTATGFSALGFGEGMTGPVNIVDYAASVEVSIVFLNSWSGEGFDRGELRNSKQDELVNEVAANCNNTIVVINSVGPRILDAWVEHENVTAVLYGSLLGQQSGNAIVDALYGRVNPSARLTYTIAKNESDYSQFAVCETSQCNFTEGNLIDYKWFDAQNVTPRFEFGFGLSYTTERRTST